MEVPSAKPFFPEQDKNMILEQIKKSLDSGWLTMHNNVEKFEKEFAKYCRVKYAVGVNSGTDALFLALLSLGIKQGDEVILPTFTYIATALAVSFIGAKPVFVDIA